MKTAARMAIAALLLAGLSFAKDRDGRDRYRYDDDDYRYRSNRYAYRNYDGSNLPPGIQKRFRDGKPLPPGQAKKLNRSYRHNDRYYRYYDRDRYYDRYNYRYWR